MATAELPHSSRWETLGVFSGEHHNPSSQRAVVHRYDLVVPGATAMRLSFGEVDLGPKDVLRVVSLTDLEVHPLTLEELDKWNYSSAWLNGEHLRLELELAPGSRGSWQLYRAVIEENPPLMTICGVDDRTPYTDSRVVRLLTSSGANASTGFVVSDDDCVITAGHALPSFGFSAEINVPPSSATGALVHPPVADQFAVDMNTLQFQNLGTGNDWGVLNLERNVNGERIADQYGWFALAGQAPAPGTEVFLPGYGTDVGALNQTLQVDSAPLSFVNGTYLQYPIDTTGGNSGSPIVKVGTNLVYGIHAVGSCTTLFGSNGGTGVWEPSLVSTLFNSCFTPPVAPPTANASVGSPAALVGQPVRFFDSSVGEIDSWAWDFDGDGAVDSSLPNPTFVYDQPGVYDVSLTVMNSLGNDVWSQTGGVTVSAAQPVGFGFLESFEASFPPNDSWYFSSSTANGTYSTQLYSPVSPQDGGKALFLYPGLNGEVSTNEVGLQLDTSNGGGFLSYWFRDVGDEDDPEDGLFLSDGTVEVLVQPHTGYTHNVWTRIEVDLTDALTQLGFPQTAWAIWRERDNWGLGSDGHGIDAVRFDASSVFSVQPDLLSAMTGGTATFQLDAGPSHAGKNYAILGSRHGTSPPITFQGFAIPLNYDGYTYATLVRPNQAERANFQSALDGLGRATASVTMPPNYPLGGETLNFCFLVYSPNLLEFVSPPVALELGP